MVEYSKEHENLILKLYNSFNETSKRHFLAVESKLLGHGSIRYLSNLLNVSEKTISRGIKEIENEDINYQSNSRFRKKGGGKKRYETHHPNIDNAFLDVLKNNTAGDPMNHDVKWTNLTQENIVTLLSEKHNIKISRMVVNQLLKKHNFKRRKLQKELPLKEVEFRDEQFIKIANLKEEYTSTGNPIISIDTKKKESIGNFFREGQRYCTETQFVFDHDFNSLADGILIPYGIYDYNMNLGYMYLGMSKDTSEFSCDNIKKWWEKYGKFNYQESTSILILCDGGGSNNSRHYLFKEDLQKLSNAINMEIRIAHYPPYTSKYNPIEHKLFCFISKSWAGVVFDNLEKIKTLIEKTTTKKGLKVEVEFVNEIYETGRKVEENFKENMSVIFDKHLPKWNYKVIPILSI